MSYTVTGAGRTACMTGGALTLTATARAVVGTAILQLSPAEVITRYIIDTLALMTDPDDRDDWPLYACSLPDGNNVKANAGGVFDTVGLSDQRSMNGTWPEHPGIQLRIRARNHAIGYKKIEVVGNALDKVAAASITIGSLEFEIQNIRRTSPIVHLGSEENKRRVNFTINFLITIRELTG